MPLVSPSKKLLRIYRSLSEYAQESLVESHLVDLLDKVPKRRAEKVILAAQRVQRQNVAAPVLDLKQKKKEILAIVDALIRDAKCSVARQYSNKEELLAEAVDCLTDWLQDIWSVVYEHRTRYKQAHQCLLFAAETLQQLDDSRGCKHYFMSMNVDVQIKIRNGRIIKQFSLSGIHKLENVLLWIWRELFVSLSAYCGSRGRRMIPEMLEDIEDVVGWRALERLLYGGCRSLVDDEYSGCESDEEYNWEAESDDHSSDMGDDKVLSRRSCDLHADHWSDRINDQRLQLRDMVYSHLLSIFKLCPSLPLYHSLMGISQCTDTESDIMKILAEVRTSSSDNFAAAIEVYCVMRECELVDDLLTTHVHLLRPQDAPVFQRATEILAQNPAFRQRCLTRLAQQLMETVRSIHAALRSSFSGIEKAEHKEEINQIIKLRSGSHQRRDRIQDWIDAVRTPGSGHPHPMQFAALLVGLPIPPGMDDMESDPFSLLDMDSDDPDVMDLREEYRPDLKRRFDGWTAIATGLTGGPVVMAQVYGKAAELMPFLRAADVVDEMVECLADKPSKHFVCEALQSLSSWSKLERKRLSMVAKRKRGAQEQAKAKASGCSGGEEVDR